jgi:hypothetical protein
VTARLAAIAACTTNSGSRLSAISWAIKPMRSRQRLAMNRHCLSMRMSSRGLTLAEPTEAARAESA